MNNRVYGQTMLEDFVATFEKLDEMTADEILDPHAWQLACKNPDEHGDRHWRPAKEDTPRSCLTEIYARLPARFPPLFERLVLSYRWAEVDLRLYRLLANPPGPNLNGLLHQMTNDAGLWDSLSPAGFIQFGKGPDIDYDPVCFDTKIRSKSGEYRVVKIDHEEILCNHRVRVVAELAPSFHHLALETIKMAAS